MTVLVGMLCGILWGGEPPATVGDGEVRRVVKEYVQQQYRRTSEEAVVEFRSIPDLGAIRSASAILRISPEYSAPLRGSVLLPLEVVWHGTVTHRFVISVRVRTFGDVLTATSLIPKHATIRRDDVQLRRIETTTVPQERVRLFDELVGKRTARIITTGSILSHAMLEPKPLIQRNETINLHVVAGHVAVVTKAIAKEDGLKNSVIEVQQVNRRERLKARVVAERTARIELE